MVAESFLPHMNGVTNSVLRIVDHFAQVGHDIQIVAPNAKGSSGLIRTACGRKVPVRRIASLPMVGYGEVRISATTNIKLGKIMSEFQPDVVHLACPTLLGGAAARAAEKLGIPTVAIYQTDIPGFTAKYGFPFLEAAAWQLLADVHNRCTMTLAPSTFTRDQVVEHGIERVSLWRRGVDTSQFSPSNYSQQLREKLAPNGEKLVVYVGRLAPEKQVEDFRALAGLSGVRLVVVGEGPEKAILASMLPNAYFAGFKKGAELAAMIATCDLFVHTGELETFCQTIQEAMASGLPAIAPRKGGPVDLIDPSHTGWLYEPGNLDQMREYVVNLLNDDSKRKAFGEAAQESVRKRTWPVLSEQLLGYYERAIEAKRWEKARGSLFA